ncbi:TPA: cytosolic protein [bacterium]|nr:cytosolic protein [bacterium]
MECRKNENLTKCNCTYEPCSRKGICCECLHYHLKMRQVPACFFSPDIEATYDRSLRRFVSHLDT